MDKKGILKALVLLWCLAVVTGAMAESVGAPVETAIEPETLCIYPIDPYRSQVMAPPLIARGGALTGPDEAVTGQTYTYTASSIAERFMVYRLEENAYSPVYLKRNTSSISYMFYETGDYLIQAGSESLNVTVARGTSGKTVTEKVNELVRACPSDGTDYEKALWFHDWLTEHAVYDNALSVYGPDGVLLRGYGVCDSYSKAFMLLCQAAGINCQRCIGTEEMNHAWNLLELDGEWFQVDVTWDDPVIGGVTSVKSGHENHDYFCATDELMSRDHFWDHSMYPSCQSLEYYHPLLNGMTGVASEAEFYAGLSEMAREKAETRQFVYIGSDADFDLSSFIAPWKMENASIYGIANENHTKREFTLTMNFTYSDTPVEPLSYAAPDFSLDSPEGTYTLDMYQGNSIILIFGNAANQATLSVLNGMKDYLPSLYDQGVEVLACLEGLSTVSDVGTLRESYEDFHFAYWNEKLMSQYVRAVGNSGSVYSPCIFMVDSTGTIYYYSFGSVSNCLSLYSRGLSKATGNPLPPPNTEHNYAEMDSSSSESIQSITGGNLIQAIQNTSGPLYVVTDSALSESVLQEYETKYSLYSKLGIQMIASFRDGSSDTASYPHVRFVEYVKDDFWELLSLAGHDIYSGAYPQCTYFLGADGKILKYANNDLISLMDCAGYLVSKVTYESTLPAELERLEAGSFTNTKMKSLDLKGTRLKVLASGAFQGCDHLEYIRLPNTVTTLEESAIPGNAIVVCPAGSEVLYAAARQGLDYVIQ